MEKGVYSVVGRSYSEGHVWVLYSVTVSDKKGWTSIIWPASISLWSFITRTPQLLRSSGGHLNVLLFRLLCSFSSLEFLGVGLPPHWSNSLPSPPASYLPTSNLRTIHNTIAIRQYLALVRTILHQAICQYPLHNQLQPRGAASIHRHGGGDWISFVMTGFDLRQFSHHVLSGSHVDSTD